ncbi:DUF2939 domain-containing protein [Oceanisphaera arctica]|uniref:DUF2939 domain-containing protein n=1 Tax=Oceanisphaera arctica TaxID=641510 RepID=A0A2P5TMU0_9GAMM|nr:DUF2939 domain-containing protein [Oceanisphaera arctica]PPL16775.1 hypothetical protein UN63_07580 [Oceanisphaera arctica]GHA05860.1 membrane protein [Oceanisphaera arctica]
MRKTKYVLLLLILGAVGYVVAAPWLTAYQISDAVDQRDSAALAEQVEFDSVRLSLKQQLNSRVLRELGADNKQNPFAALGASLANMMVDGLLDTYMTPVGIERLMRGETPAPGIPESSPLPPSDTGGSNDSDTGKSDAERKKLFSDARMGYQTLDRFVVTVTDEKGREADFVLSRRGLDWKLTAIVLPLD